MMIKNAGAMKKYFSIFAAAFAALSVLSCQRELEPQGGELETNLVPMQVVSSVDAKSSLELDGDAPTGRVLWDYGDEISVFDGVGARQFTTTDITDPEGHAHVVTFDGNVDADATAFAAIYPYSAGYTAESYDASTRKILAEIPSLQTVSEPGSYSRYANVCVAYAARDDQEQVPAEDEEYIMTQMFFRNVGGLLKFTLSQDGVHRSVTIRTSDASPLTGAIVATADTGTAVAAETGSADFVTIAAADGGFLAAGDYYAVVLPFSDKTVSLEFSDNLLSKKRKSSAKISLGRAAIRDLGTIDSGVTYPDGQFLILAKKNDKYYALKAEKDGENDRMVSVGYTGSTVSYLGDADLVWTLSKSNASYILSNDGKYLGYQGTENRAFWLEAGEEWKEINYLLDITAQATEGLYYVTLHANGAKYLSRNSNSSFFAFYGNNGQYADLVFVPAAVETRTRVVMSFSQSDVARTTSDYAAFTGQTVTVMAGEVDVTAAVAPSVRYVMEGDEIGSVVEASGAVTLNGTKGTATVTARFTGDDTYAPAEDVTYTITVAESAVTPSYYVKVTSAPSDWSGEYLMVCENRGEVLSKISTTSTKYGIGATVKFEDIDTAKDSIKVTDAVDTCKIVIAKASNSAVGYTLHLASADSYLYWTSGNSLDKNSTESNNTRWKISAGNTTGNWIIKNVQDSTRVIWYNTGSPRFACYTAKTESSSGYAAIQLYKLQDNTVWDLKGIAVKTTPTKVMYDAGEHFNPAGLVITATYSDHDGIKADKKVDVAYSNDTAEAFSFDPTTSDVLTVDDDEVSITWGGKSTTQAITVIKWVLNGIEITTNPTKTSYVVGDSFNPAGMVVTGHYIDNGGSEETKDAVIDSDDLTIDPEGPYTTAGNVTVTVSYGGFDDTVDIEVVDSGSGPEDLNAPSGVSVSSISATGFTASWTAPTGGAPLGYTWILTDNSNPDASVTPVASGTALSSAVSVSPSVSITTGGPFYFHIKATGDGVSYNESAFVSSSAKTNFSCVYTSNVTVGSEKISVGGTQYNCAKVGTSKAGGSTSVSVPSGTTKLHVHMAAYGTGTPTISISGGSADPSSIKISGGGISGNSPYTLSTGYGYSHYYVITLSEITSSTTITFTTPSGGTSRFVLWGCNAE